jgi:hypothetical protein
VEELGNFLGEVAEFIQMQLFDVSHDMVGEIDLYGCFQLRGSACYQREGELILPEQTAIVIHQI